MLTFLPQTNIGYVATTTFIKDAHLRPNDVSNSISLLSVTFVFSNHSSPRSADALAPSTGFPRLCSCGVQSAWPMPV